MPFPNLILSLALIGCKGTFSFRLTEMDKGYKMGFPRYHPAKQIKYQPKNANSKSNRLYR